MTSSPNKSVLAASHVRHEYGRVQALESVSLSLERETFTCLVGASGSGKSTLLRILAGLMTPTAGDIYLNGEPLSQPHKHIGIVFQDPRLMPWRTVRQNMMLPLEVIGAKKDRERATQLLEMLGLADFANAYPATLSGGMAQRLAIGRALIHDPAVLLLDEPFGALDAITREQLSVELLRIWSRERKTIFMVTHNIQEAVFLADRVLVLSPRPGRIIADIAIPLGRPRQLDMVTDTEFNALEARVRQNLRV